MAECLRCKERGANSNPSDCGTGCALHFNVYQIGMTGPRGPWEELQSHTLPLTVSSVAGDRQALLPHLSKAPGVRAEGPLTGGKDRDLEWAHKAVQGEGQEPQHYTLWSLRPWAARTTWSQRGLLGALALTIS